MPQSESLERDRLEKCSTPIFPHPRRNEENDASWIMVDAEEQNEEEGENDDRSLVEVSRASSPLNIRFIDIHNGRGTVHMSVPWPTGLPWFQFQDVCFNHLTSPNLISQGHCVQAALVQNREHSDNQDDNSQELNRHSATSTFARQIFSGLGSHKGFQKAMSEVNSYMPERYEGENAANLRALVSPDLNTAKMKEIEMFSYKLSNNMIDGVGYDQENYRYESVLDAKYFSIIDMYHEIDLPRSAWRRFFNQKSRNTSPTGSALLEKLFEAAVMTAQHHIVEFLLEAGADPNQLVRNYLTGILQRPIQFAVQRLRVKLDLLKMLIDFGANTNLTSDSDTTTALEEAATDCSLEAIVMLVEAGAEIRAPIGDDESEDSVNDRPAVLVRVMETAANSHKFHYRCHAMVASEEETSAGSAEEGEKEEEEEAPDDDSPKKDREELAAMEILAYLTPLYNQDTDHEALQSALLGAAAAGRTDMFDLLLSAGAKINEMIWPGYTPLIAATQRCCMCRSFGTVSKLLDLGANVNRLVDDSKKMGISALHIAALRGHDRVVQLLVDRGANINGYARIARHTIHLFGESKRCSHDLIEAIRRCRTPLELALNACTSSFNEPAKTAAAALILVRAGVKLGGGEFAKAPCLGDASPLTRLLLEELIARGADVNELDQVGHSALYNAIKVNAVDLVSYLLEVGVDLHGDELRHAIRGGNQHIIEVIMQHMGLSRIEEDAARADEQVHVSLLETAALSRNWGLMTWLTQTHNLPYNPTALCAAIGLGLGSWEKQSNERDLQYLELLLGARPADFKDDSPMEATALAYAAFNALTSEERSHRLLARLLEIPTFAAANATCILPEKEDSSWYGGIIASGFMTVNCCNVWNEHFWRDPGMARCSLLAPFIALERWEIVERFLGMGHRPDNVSLLMAIRYAPLAQIYRLTKHMSLASLSGAWPCRFDTPLQAAIRLRRKDVVEHLLHQGVDVNAAPATQKTEIVAQITEYVLPRTAFQAAVEKGDLEIMELLLEAGADVNGSPADNSGATALQIAAATGQIGIARRLIELGADINASGARIHGRTALEAAAEHGRLDMVHFLLEVGSKIFEPTAHDSIVSETGVSTPSIAARQFWRAKRLATKNGHIATAQLLKRLGMNQYTEEVSQHFSTHDNCSDDSDYMFTTSDGEDGINYSSEDEGSDVNESSDSGSDESDGYDNRSFEEGTRESHSTQSEDDNSSN